MKSIISRMTIVIVIMFTITIANAQKAVELTYNLNVGDKYEFNTELSKSVMKKFLEINHIFISKFL